MKRKIYVLTAAILFSLVMTITSMAANASIRFSDPSVSVGQEVNVTMKITSEDNAGLKDVNITLKYPSDKLEFVSGTDADGGAGTIRVHGTSNGSGKDTVEYNLKFKTSSAGTFNIKADTYEVYDESGKAFTLTHIGESAVTVTAKEGASVNCDLKSLEIYPGDLTPSFSGTDTEYSAEVGSSVEKLSITAVPSDEGANIRIENNDSLQIGENNILITVVAADGVTEKQYRLLVNKTENGPESEYSENESDQIEGVQLSSKGKSITILNPSSDVTVPEGLVTGTISIDGQKVQGWVSEGAENPEYCVVYGMNDQGELNFYRYDRVEKTIQRYFEEIRKEDYVSLDDYNDISNKLSDSESRSQILFIGICACAAIAFILLIVVVYLTVRINTINKNQRRQAELKYNNDSDVREYNNNTEETDISISDFDENQEDNDEKVNPIDETQVITRSERRRRKKADSIDDIDL